MAANTRRTVIVLSVVLFLAALAATILSLLPKVEYRDAQSVPIGRPADYPANSVSDRFLARFNFYVVNDGTGIFAISAKCTHLGCTVNWEARTGTFDCPCHRSRFERNGNVVQSPAKKPLPRLGLRYDPSIGLVVKIDEILPPDKDPLSPEFYFLIGSATGALPLRRRDLIDAGGPSISRISIARCNGSELNCAAWGTTTCCCCNCASLRSTRISSN